MSEPVEQLCESVAAPESFVDAVSRVLAEVLETMFFAEAIATDCGHDWLSSAVGARIGFAGSHLGELRLSISRDAADSIGCAFLGLEPLEITEPLCTQVILELTNILCGDILSHLWPESKLALGPPELCAEEPAVEGALHQCFEVPEGKLAVWIRWSEAAG